MVFNIVSNSILQRQIKGIDIFQLDLGMSLLNKKDSSIEFKDSFVEMYANTNGSVVHKFGRIGSINFYTDLRLPHNVLVIHADNKVFEILYEIGDLPMKQFLSESIRMIEEHIIESEKELKEVQEDASKKLWVAHDDKNGEKAYEVNQKLSREEYLKQMLDKKK